MFKIVGLLCGTLFFSQLNTQTKSFLQDVNEFYNALPKILNGDPAAYNMASSNPLLTINFSPSSEKCAFDMALELYNKANSNAINNSRLVELIELMIKQNIIYEKAKPFNTLSIVNMKKRIGSIVKDKSKKNILFLLLDNAMRLNLKQISAPSVSALEEDFFANLAGNGNSEFLLIFINNNPSWGKKVSFEKHLTPLLLMIKNYSGTSSQDELIKLLIKINPASVVLANVNGATPISESKSHNSYVDYLLKMIRNELSKYKADKNTADDFFDAINNDNYKKALQLFTRFPQLAYAVNSSSKSPLVLLKAKNNVIDDDYTKLLRLLNDLAK